jgi:hypothetical protein
MRIILAGRSRQYETFVSAEDYEHLTQWLWTFAVSHPRHGGLVYVRRSIRVSDVNVTLFMHHVVLERMGRPRPSSRHTADHVNGNSLDNQRHNLRWATRKQQMANRCGFRADPIWPPARTPDAIPF